MKPLSAAYYVKENKGRSTIVIFLLFMTTLLFLAGNYVDSVYYYWDRYEEYTDKLCVVSALSTDENFEEFAAVYRDLAADEKLIVQKRTPRGTQGLSWICTMGFEMGTASVVFDSPEDLKEAFDVLGIRGDVSGMENGTVCISTALAKQYGLRKGDILDASIQEGFKGSYKIAALIEDDSYIVFYVIPYEGVPLRLNVLSRELSGQALRDYVNAIVAGRKAEVDHVATEMIEKQFSPFKLIFGVGMVLLSLVLAVIVNSVITGQYMARTYEFGVYRAIGLSKGAIYAKVAGELLLTDFLAILCGGVLTVVFTFLMNELFYLPKGQFLPYYSNMGMMAFLVSNALVVVPTILLKGRSMSRSDVTEF